MFVCLNCGTKFEENNAVIVEYGTGAINTKVELLGCYECESTNIQDLVTKKIQS